MILYRCLIDIGIFSMFLFSYKLTFVRKIHEYLQLCINHVYKTSKDTVRTLGMSKLFEVETNRSIQIQTGLRLGHRNAICFNFLHYIAFFLGEFFCTRLKEFTYIFAIAEVYWIFPTIFSLNSLLFREPSNVEKYVLVSILYSWKLRTDILVPIFPHVEEVSWTRHHF